MALIHRPSSAYGLRPGRNYTPKEPGEETWVFLQDVGRDPAGRWVATYRATGGYGPSQAISARDFRRRFRRLFDRGGR